MLIQGLLMTSGETERFRNQFDRLSQDEEEPEPLSSSPLAADAEDQFSCSPEIPDINSWKRPDLQQLCKRKKIKFNARDTRKHRLVEFYLNAKREELKQSQKRKTSNKGASSSSDSSSDSPVFLLSLIHPPAHLLLLLPLLQMV